MKKIIIISYFYPPSAFVGGERTAYWAENLWKHGYFPIVITRQWNEGQKDIIGLVHNNQKIIEEHEHYEVHRLPHLYTYRDRLENIGAPRFLRKVFSFFERFLSYFSTRFLSYSNFKNEALRLIEKDNIHGIICSGRPFQSFKIASEISTQTGVPWIADYRDSWTSQKAVYNDFREGIFYQLEKMMEVRVAKSLDVFISTTDSFCDSIEKTINRKGICIRNGLDELSLEPADNTLLPKKQLSLVFIGTLQSYQSPEFLISLLGQLEKRDFIIEFIGVESIPETPDHLKTLISKHNVQGTVSTKMPKQELFKYLDNFDVALNFNYKNLRDVLPVKLFTYFECGLPTLIYPANLDSEQVKFIEATNSGWAFEEEYSDKVKILLLDLLARIKSGQKLHEGFNYQAAREYTREYQTKKLAKVLDQYFIDEKKQQ